MKRLDFDEWILGRIDTKEFLGRVWEGMPIVPMPKTRDQIRAELNQNQNNERQHNGR